MKVKADDILFVLMVIAFVAFGIQMWIGRHDVPCRVPAAAMVLDAGASCPISRP